MALDRPGGSLKVIAAITVLVVASACFVGTATATVAEAESPTWVVPGAMLFLVNTGSSLLNGLFVLGGKGTEFTGSLGIFSGAASLFVVGVAMIGGGLDTSESETLSVLAFTAIPSIALGLRSHTNARRMKLSPMISRNGDGTLSRGVSVSITF